MIRHAHQKILSNCFFCCHSSPISTLISFCLYYLLSRLCCEAAGLTVNYSGFPRIRNHFFGYSLLFLNNSLLFYPLFYMKIEICILCKGVSYLREPLCKGELNLVCTSSFFHKEAPCVCQRHIMVDLH